MKFEIHFISKIIVKDRNEAEEVAKEISEVTKYRFSDIIIKQVYEKREEKIHPNQKTLF